MNAIDEPLMAAERRDRPAVEHFARIPGRSAVGIAADALQQDVAALRHKPVVQKLTLASRLFMREQRLNDEGQETVYAFGERASRRSRARRSGESEFPRCNSAPPVHRGQTAPNAAGRAVMLSGAASRDLPPSLGEKSPPPSPSGARWQATATAPCGATASAIRPPQVRTLTPLGRSFEEHVTSCRAGGSHFLCSEAEGSLVAVIVTFCVVPLNAKAPGPAGLIISLSPEIAKIPPSSE